MRVAHITDNLDACEAVPYILRIRSALPHSTHLVLTMAGDDIGSDALRMAGIDVVHLEPVRVFGFVRSVFALKRALRLFGPNVVQSWSLSSALAGTIAAKMLGINRIFWSNVLGSDVASGFKVSRLVSLRLLGLLSYFGPRKIFVMSSELKASSVSFFRPLKQKIVVQPHATPTSDGLKLSAGLSLNELSDGSSSSLENLDGTEIQDFLDGYREVRVLALPRYDSRGPSSRVRFYQFLPFAKESGVEITWSPFFTGRYLSNRFLGKILISQLPTFYLRRVATILKNYDCDLVWVEKELLPWVPYWVEKLLLKSRTPLILDFDDAIFHNYDLAPSAILKRLFGKKISNLIGIADATTVGNSYLEKFARESGAKRVVFVPSVWSPPDANGSSRESVANRGEKLIVGWIGTPITWREHGSLIADVVRKTAERHGAEFWIVGSGLPAGRIGNQVTVDWELDTESQMLRLFDIGVMPLTDSPWSRGKCGYKVSMYLTFGTPFVASPVGINIDLISESRAGFAASSIDEWDKTLSQLLANDRLRSTMSASAWSFAKERLDINRLGPEVAQRLVDTANQPAWRTINSAKHPSGGVISELSDGR